MANPDAPFGMRQDTVNGAPFVGVLNRYHIPVGNATILAVGDPVVSTGSADPDGVPDVGRAAAGASIRGYIVGFEYDRAFEDLPNFLPASTEAYALVADDPSGRVLLQEDSDAGALAVTDVGLNVNFIVANANSVTGRSQVEIDSSTAATTITLPLKLLQLYQREDNEIGANAIWECSFNIHELKDDSGSLGK